MELFVDIHAHAFNWQHVPIEGFLRSRGLSKGAAERLTDLLIDIAGDPTMVALMEREVRDGPKRTAIAAALFLLIQRGGTVAQTKVHIDDIVHGRRTVVTDSEGVVAELPELRGADEDRAHWVETFLFVLTLLQDTSVIGERLVDALVNPLPSNNPGHPPGGLETAAA